MMDTTTWVLLASVALIVLAIIVPKPGQRHRAERIAYLLDQERRRDDE